MTEHEYKRFRDASIEATENMYRQMAYDVEKRGKTEGEAIGIAKGKKEMAIKLYDAGIDVQIIKDTTGFTKQQIKSICL